MSSLELDGFGQLVPRGAGGLGDVYQAVRLSTGAPVAIKVLRDWSDESVAWHRAQRELRALVDLKGHPHVVHVEEVVEIDDVPHLVMEYAAGGSLSEIMRDRGAPLTLPEAVLVGEQTASALTAAHRLGIIHLDIKPQNLLVGGFGQIKVCDFGISALTSTEQFRQRTGAVSIRYASPEQLEDRPDVGPSADVYSLGATLVHLLSGEPPALATSVRSGSLPFSWERPDHLDTTVVEAFDGLLAACLRVDPAQRPTAADLVAAFDELGSRLGAFRCRSLIDAFTHVEARGLAPIPRRLGGRTDPSHEPAGPPVAGPGAQYAVPPVPVAEPSDHDVPAWVVWMVGGLTVLVSAAAVAVVMVGR